MYALFACPLHLQASYGVEDPEYAVSQLAQTTMRSELGACPIPRGKLGMRAAPFCRLAASRHGQRYEVAWVLNVAHALPFLLVAVCIFRMRVGVGCEQAS